jgi:hypothetical protein
MRLNVTVILTFTLLALMFGAGVVSASWGFTLGREALKGITQPDVRPTSNVGSRKGNPAGGKEMVILKEENILKSVKRQIEGKEAQKDEK